MKTSFSSKAMLITAGAAARQHAPLKNERCTSMYTMCGNMSVRQHTVHNLPQILWPAQASLAELIHSRGQRILQEPRALLGEYKK